MIYPHIYLHVKEKNGKTRYYHALITRRQRIHHRIASFSNAEFKIKVGYGKQLDNFRKMVMFDNCGTYTNKRDAKYMLNAFLEKD